jgi:hypothetical protein
MVQGEDRQRLSVSMRKRPVLTGQAAESFIKKMRHNEQQMKIRAAVKIKEYRRRLEQGESE